MQLIQGKFRRQSLGLTATAVVCLVLLTLISIVQFQHLHQSAGEYDRCAVCLAMHAAAPVSMAAAVVVLVRLGISATPVTAQALALGRRIQLFTRPPPRSR